MLKLTQFSLKNPFAIIMICLLLVIGGTYAFTTFKTALLPDIEFPLLSVTAVYPGASPQDVIEKVTKPLEESLNGVQQLNEIQSDSRESFTRIQLSFPLEADIDELEDSANDALSSVSLPDEVEVSIDRLSFDALPVISLALFSQNEADQDFESWVENTLRTEMLNIAGVSQVVITGARENYLTFIVNKEEAQALGINLNQIKEVIEAADFSFPAGNMTENEQVIPVRIEQGLSEIDTIMQLGVDSFVQEDPVLLGDILTIESLQERNEYSRYNGQDALSINVFKRPDVNTVETADDVMEVLERYENRLEFAVNFDQATDIKASINGLIEKGLLGALFTALVVLVFLRNIRATAIALVSIPLSLLIGAILMSWMNITLNVMSLAGMAVAVGRVVDDSIIVIENIYRKTALRPDMARSTLALEGTAEMKNPILTSTLTSIVVFLPLGLVGGVTSAFFLPFALTIVFTLLASFFVAITLVPILAQYSFMKIKEGKPESWIARKYESVIRSGLKRKWVVILLAFVLLIGSLPFATQLGFVFLPNEDQRIIQAAMTLPAATSLTKTDEYALQVEEELLNRKDDFEQIFTSIGGFDFISGQSLDNRAEFFVELKSTITVDEALLDIQERLESVVMIDFPEAVISVQELQTSGPPTNNNVNVDLFATDMQKLDEAATIVEEMMLARDDLRYVRNNMQEKQSQWKISLDALEMNEMGLNPGMIFGLVGDQTRAVDLGTYTFNNEDQSVQLRYDRDLQGIDDLGDIQIFTGQGVMSLNELADIEKEEVTSSIQRLNQDTYARVSAQILGDNVFSVSADVEEAASQLVLPEGVTFLSGGGSDEALDTFMDLILAIVISIGLVYITLLVFFGKARLPLIILTSLIFVPVGSIVALWIANEPLSISAMIGLLMLVGIVVTNAVVLIDRINQNRDQGDTIRVAVIEAAKTRVRPILMTAFATIAALLPLAFSAPEGGLISRGLALVVIGGLTTSTFLTLVFVPVIYELAFYKDIRREKQAEGEAIIKM